MKELSRHKISPIKMDKGDTLEVRRQLKYPDGTVTLTPIAKYDIREKMTMDTCIFIAPENGEFNLSEGIGAIIGKEIKKRRKLFGK